MNGNINVVGTIKANGVDGTAQQVLMKNNSGNMVWGDLCDFKTKATFSGTGNNYWTVSAGVTKIVAECWGAGGGGNGTGAGYIAADLTVTPGSILNIFVGNGGTTSGLSATNGAPSFVAVGSISITAFGGSGAIYDNTSKTHSIGYGGEYTVTTGYPSYQGLVGEAGDFNRVNYVQAGTSTFYEVCEGGRGEMQPIP